MKCQSCKHFIFFRKMKLLCGHTFHIKCVKTKENCPLCKEHIFKDLNLKILTSTNQVFIQKSINNTSKVECKHLLKKAVDMNNTPVIVHLTHRIKNIKSLALDFIKEGNITALNRLMVYYKVKTNVKYAMLDTAIETEKIWITNAVVNIVGDKVEYNYFNNYVKTPTTKATTIAISGHSMLPSGDLFNI